MKFQYLQQSHEGREVFKLYLLGNVLSLDVLILVGYEDEVAVVSPAVFLNPVLQGHI